MTTHTLEEFVEVKVEGRLGVITLNRPKALNAINLDMVRTISAAVGRWENDDRIDAILIRSGIERAFCSGGDVRAIGILPEPVDRVTLAREFFSAEFALNCRINRLRKPYVALINGIAMGGGLGLSIHGSHRVVCETTRMAMPETVLGYFPDVGATWFLSRCPGAIGRYLALAGSQIGPADAIWTKLATHYVPYAAFDDVTHALAARSSLDHDQVDAIIDRFSAQVEESPISLQAPSIDDVFGSTDLRTALTKVTSLAERDEWAVQACANLQRACPTSLHATWGRMVNGAGQSIEQVLVNDFRMALRMVGRDDFQEGVRAVLVDKDQSPRWRPASVSDVSNESVNGLLAPFSLDSDGPFAGVEDLDLRGWSKRDVDRRSIEHI